MSEWLFFLFIIDQYNPFIDSSSSVSANNKRTVRIEHLISGTMMANHPSYVSRLSGNIVTVYRKSTWLIWSYLLDDVCLHMAVVLIFLFNLLYTTNLSDLRCLCAFLFNIVMLAVVSSSPCLTVRLVRSTVYGPASPKSLSFLVWPLFSVFLLAVAPFLILFDHV